MPQITDWVIDADAHISEPADLWSSRLAARYRNRAPRIQRNQDGVDIWHVGDNVPVVPLGHTAVAGWHEPFPSAPKNMEEIPRAAWEAQARLAYMDEVGIWAQAIYPNVGGFGNQGFLKLDDPGLMLACVQAYNDFLIEWIEPAPGRFIPIMAVPFWDVEASVKEIERCARLGHKGILFSGEPQNVGMPMLGDRHWDRFYAAAQDVGLPISFHIGSGDFDSAFAPARISAHGIGATVSYATVSLLIENGKQITDLLFSGVLPRFPELKFISVESGIGFIPFILEAADHTYSYSNIRAERPELSLLPSEYFKRQVYACYFFEEFAPQQLAERVGVDNILFETDYPHPVCLYGNVREKIDAGLVGKSKEVRDKLLWSNAAKLYQVDAPTRAWTPPAKV
jgi:predicted TIM-barrel fold metal-dependent hydrolase